MRKPLKVDCSLEPSRTQQQFKNECDINVIVKNCIKNEINPFESLLSFQEDVTSFECPDYAEAHRRVRAADQAFLALPSKIRQKFYNDPAKMLSWLDDPANAQEARALGLVSTPAVEDIAPPVEKQQKLSPSMQKKGGAVKGEEAPAPAGD